MDEVRDPFAAAEDRDDDMVCNPSYGTPIGDIIAARIGRRRALGGMLALTGAGLLGFAGAGHAGPGNGKSTLTFTEIPHGYDGTLHVPPGYAANVLIRWGDAVAAGAPPFDPANQSAAAQLKQFGYNNDYVAFMPLPAGSANSGHGLLCVNHEYTSPKLMFAGYSGRASMTRAEVDIEMAAHGHSVIEVRRVGGKWHVAPESQYNRRISALETRMRVSGPAAGNDRLKTRADPTGRNVVGTLNNCAGGKTPWGTVLIAEENFHGYFGGDLSQESEARNYKRYGVKSRSRYAWLRHHGRFDLAREPNEPNRFGWIVEFDPYDPRSTPVKRTALGRFKHEGATTIVNRDGRIVAYSGDDQRFEYIYRFVSHGRYDPNNRAANRNLLDDGTLFVARFNRDGTLVWLPLVWGAGRMTPENGFRSQADVLIETRRAADIVGATPMDRPEDFEPNPVTGAVYVMLTNNFRRLPGDTNPANPRSFNRYGHILELIPPGGRGRNADHAAATFRWEIPVLCGDPEEFLSGARYHPGVTRAGWLTSPDNCAFDPKGRLWIATDGAPNFGFADGLWAMDVEEPGRALTRHFLATPRGSEMCGPEFARDGRTLFCAVQHPAREKGSSFDHPSTRWPDFKPGMPPRPSVVAVTRSDGGIIGG